MKPNKLVRPPSEHLHELYCLEYSEYSSHHGYPWHIGTLFDATENNLQDFYWNNRQENKWQIVFVGSQNDCSLELDDLVKKKKQLLYNQKISTNNKGVSNG